LTVSDISDTYSDMHKRDRIYFMNPGRGGPEFGGPEFGGGPFFKMRMQGPGPGGPFGFGPRRHRMRRGNVRAAILLLLEDTARNGYQLMQELEERSGGAWRPSPGSMYPALQLLADEGLIRGETRDGGTVYELTDAGRKHIEEHREQLGSPWEVAGAGVPDNARELMHLAMQLGIAARQVIQAGSEEQTKAAAEILTDARKKLYGILASD
jgi:DNA-binding PadR family transcriptional regulator